METLNLKAFYCVAQMKNFSRAAEALYISQPALSRKISNLEDELGVTLFIRNNRIVQLTRAGEVLQEECEKIFYLIEESITKVKRAVSEANGAVSIGLTGVEGVFLNNIINRFNSKYPQTELKLSQFRSSDLMHKLKEGMVDVGFLLEFDAKNMAGFDYFRVWAAPLYAVLSVQHELSDRDSIDVKELEKYRIVQFNPESNPLAKKDTELIFQTYNFSPSRSIYVNSLIDMLNYIRNDIAVAILLKDSLGSQQKDIRYIRIEGLPIRREICAVWNQEGSNSALPDFISVLQELAQESE